MGQNTVNCVTVGWQAVCYFNSCPSISFLLSLANFLSFLAPLICSHISYPCALHPPHPPIRLYLLLPTFRGFSLPLFTSSACLPFVYPLNSYLPTSLFILHLCSPHFMSCPAVINTDRQDASKASRLFPFKITYGRLTSPIKFIMSL